MRVYVSQEFAKAGAGMRSGWNSAANIGESCVMSALVRTSKTCSKKHMPKMSHHVNLVRAYRVKCTALHVYTQSFQKMYDGSMMFFRMQDLIVCSWLANKIAKTANGLQVHLRLGNVQQPNKFT